MKFKGHRILPKSVIELMIRANFLLDFEMPEVAVKVLDGIEVVKKYAWNPVDAV